MQAIDLHKKIQQITKQCEYDGYIPVVYIADLLGVTSETISSPLTVLKDLRFLEYRRSLNEKIRLTFTGKLANLGDYSGISNDFEKVIPCPLDKEENNTGLLLPTTVSI